MEEDLSCTRSVNKMFQDTVSQVKEHIDTKKEVLAPRFRKYNERPKYYANTYKYSSILGSWGFVPYQTLNRKFTGHVISSLRVLTYNIWFKDDENFDLRASKIIQYLKVLNADIIGLQEVTPKFLQKLVKYNWVKDNYYLSEITGRSFCGYGNILMTKLQPTGIFCRPLESKMGRNLIFAEFRLASSFGNVSILRIGVVHLESLDKNIEIRKLQLQQIANSLTKPINGTKLNAILMGDFNIDPNSQEEIESINEILVDFKDCGTLLSEIPQPTKHINYPQDDKLPVRHDRIMLSSTGKKITLTSFDTFGNDPLSKDEITCFPSDHLGIYCDFEVQKPKIIK